MWRNHWAGSSYHRLVRKYICPSVSLVCSKGRWTGDFVRILDNGRIVGTCSSLSVQLIHSLCPLSSLSIARFLEAVSFAGLAVLNPTPYVSRCDRRYEEFHRWKFILSPKNYDFSFVTFCMFQSNFRIKFMHISAFLLLTSLSLVLFLFWRGTSSMWEYSVRMSVESYLLCYFLYIASRVTIPLVFYFSPLT